MNKILYILIIISLCLLILPNLIISQYINYKFTNWLSRDLEISRIKFSFPNKILIEDISIKNDNFYKYKNTFEADKIYIDLNLKSYFFENLKIVNQIIFVNPILYLEIIERKNIDNNNNVYYTDNLGIADKISQNIPDKEWPKKKIDKNFVILNANIKNIKTFIISSSLKNEFKFNLNDMKFNDIGNIKGGRHYKDLIKIIYLQILSYNNDINLEKLLKNVYKKNK